LTLTNPLYLPFIKKFFPNLIIYSSVNCYLRTYEQAIFFKNLGFNVLTIDRDINRDLELIQKIKNRTGIRLQMLVNE
jgi:collagenase-like PrtC family protease